MSVDPLFQKGLVKLKEGGKDVQFQAGLGVRKAWVLFRVQFNHPIFKIDISI